MKTIRTLAAVLSWRFLISCYPHWLWDKASQKAAHEVAMRARRRGA